MERMDIAKKQESQLVLKRLIARPIAHLVSKHKKDMRKKKKYIES